jgi:uncharacterized protein YndB with AHSA1/START domain
MTDTAARSAAGYREFAVTRVFNAPCELVFRAWTQPEHFASWWGGEGMSTPLESMRMDVRPGGEWYACMRSDADGTEHPFAGVYREIVANERLVMTISEGHRPDPDREHLLTIKFTEVDGKTEMAFSQAGDFGDDADEMFKELSEGYGKFFARLATTLQHG